MMGGGREGEGALFWTWYATVLGQGCHVSRTLTAEIFLERRVEQELGLRLAAEMGSWDLWRWGCDPATELGSCHCPHPSV